MISKTLVTQVSQSKFIKINKNIRNSHLNKQNNASK